MVIPPHPFSPCAFHPSRWSLPCPQPAPRAGKADAGAELSLSWRRVGKPNRSRSFSRLWPCSSTRSPRMTQQLRAGYRAHCCSDAGIPSAGMLFSAQERHVTWTSPFLSGVLAGAARRAGANVRPRVGGGGQGAQEDHTLFSALVF